MQSFVDLPVLFVVNKCRYVLLLRSNCDTSDRAADAFWQIDTSILATS